MHDGLAGSNVPYPAEAQLQPSTRRLDITLRQNIDQQIAFAEKHLETLKDTKARLEQSGILDTRMDDLHRAMRF